MHTAQEVYNLNVSPMGRPQQNPGPSFEVVEGRGLDAQVRQGVSLKFLFTVKTVLVVGVAVASIAFCRVALFSAAASTLTTNSALRSEVKAAQQVQDGLRIERSVLSSTSRIDRIATQTYGMVAASSFDHISVGDAAEKAAEKERAAAESASESTSQNGEGQGTSQEATSGMENVA